MSIMMAGILQLPNHSKEHKLVKATTFPRDSKSEVDYVENNVNVKPVLLEGTNSLDTVLCRDDLGRERISKSLFPQTLPAPDIEKNDSDEELEKAIEADYSSPDSDEPKIIGCRLNKEAEGEIDKLTGQFRSSVIKTIVGIESQPDSRVKRNCKKREDSKHEYGETGILHDGTFPVEKTIKSNITITVEHDSSISSNSSSSHSFCEGRKSLIWKPTDSPSKETGTDPNNLGQSKLPLPPRLREASYRNPLSIKSFRRDSIELPPSGPFDQLFSPKAPSERNSVKSALWKMVKKQKDISVKLWRSNLHFIRELGKLEFPRHS